MESIIKKSLSDDEAKVAWLACITKGTPVNNCNWILRGGCKLYEGYKATRIVKGEDGVFKVVCAIDKSNLNELPYISISAFKLNVTENNTYTFSETANKRVTSLKLTIAANEILRLLKVKTMKKWSGTQLFGLDWQDVKKILNNDARHNITTTTITKTFLVTSIWVIKKMFPTPMR